ncbi:hypothetical protein [Acinetobacter rudis]|nr:hypothetical protein [Acinetobacter rudis]
MILERDFLGEEKQFKYSEQGLLVELQQPHIKTIFGYDDAMLVN